MPRYSNRAGKRKNEITSKFKFGLISPKGLDSIDNSNAWLNIWYGAIRSSKTICSILAWIYFLSVSPHTEFLMSGRTRGSLYRNVLLPFLGSLMHCILNISMTVTLKRQLSILGIKLFGCLDTQMSLSPRRLWE